jgi:hypothetical protein
MPVISAGKNKTEQRNLDEGVAMASPFLSSSMDSGHAGSSSSMRSGRSAAAYENEVWAPEPANSEYLGN